MLPLDDPCQNMADKADTVRAVLAYVYEALCWLRPEDGGLSADGATGLCHILRGCDALLKEIR